MIIIRMSPFRPYFDTKTNTFSLIASRGSSWHKLSSRVFANSAFQMHFHVLSEPVNAPQSARGSDSRMKSVPCQPIRLNLASAAVLQQGTPRGDAWRILNSLSGLITNSNSRMSFFIERHIVMIQKTRQNKTWRTKRSQLPSKTSWVGADEMMPSTSLHVVRWPPNGYKGNGSAPLSPSSSSHFSPLAVISLSVLSCELWSCH